MAAWLTTLRASCNRSKRPVFESSCLLVRYGPTRTPRRANTSSECKHKHIAPPLVTILPQPVTVAPACTPPRVPSRSHTGAILTLPSIFPLSSSPILTRLVLVIALRDRAMTPLVKRGPGDNFNFLNRRIQTLHKPRSIWYDRVVKHAPLHNF